MSRWPIIGALYLQAFAVLFVLADVDSPVRVVVTLAWALLVPGYAVVVHLRFDEVTRLILSVAVSLAVALFAAQALVWLGGFSTEATTLLVAGVASIGLAAALPRGARTPGAVSTPAGAQDEH